MIYKISVSLITFLFLCASQISSDARRMNYVDVRSRLSSLFSPLSGSYAIGRRQNSGFQSSNGAQFLWALQDVYEGKDFFNRWSFSNQGDPTHGSANFINETAAFADGLAYITDDNVVVMKGDNTSWLAAGEVRNSVRISSVAQYNTGLFIIDLNQAPWGCGVWPAFLTSGPNWPYNGAIDILEGVHDNEHNQVTWHTGPDCYLTPSDNFTGSLAGTLDCDSTVSGAPGCGIIEWSRASYGPYFAAQGGGVFAMKWDDQGIAVWSFYRAGIPPDITDGTPHPLSWGKPAAELSPNGCDPLKFFVNHSIIFDITFCGDWAGNSYANTTCPGTCSETLMNPNNFVNASWSINSLKVYQKLFFTGTISSSTGRPTGILHSGVLWMLALLALGISY